MKNKKQNNIFTKILGFFILLSGLIIFDKVLVPMILGIIALFLALLKVYPLLSLEYKFLGGCFFLVIFYYTFSVVLDCTFILFKEGWRLIKQ